MQGHLDRLDRDMAPLRRSRDALGAQAYASQLVGQFEDGDDGLDHEALARLCFALHGRATPESRALLRALATVAPSSELRVVAGAYDEGLAGLGVPEPLWECDIYETVDAHEYADVFGDQRVILCTFAGGPELHALIGFINTSHRGGHFDDLILTTSITKAHRGFTDRAAGSSGLFRYERLDPSAAQSILTDALTVSFQTRDIEPEVLALRALLGARLAGRVSDSVPGARASDRPDTDRPDTDKTDIALFATSETVRSRGLTADTVAGFLEDITDFGTEFDAGRIMRLSPAKLDAFVSWSTRLDPSALRAWVEWVLATSEQRTLPRSAQARLRERLDELLPPEPARTIRVDPGLVELIDHHLT